jgi:acyl carrier protein
MKFETVFLEEKIREFLKNEFVMDHIDFLSVNDELLLDSLAQTELRIFLEDEFNIPTDLSAMSAGSSATLGAIIQYIVSEKSKTVN